MLFLSRAVRAHPEFRRGARDMMPVAPGIAAWGLMTGVAMIKSGMSVWEALFMGTIVYAGSSQLAAMPLLAAGAPFWVILATSFCVNLRFVVFSVHLRGYMMHLPLWRRLLTGYVIADMSYVMFTQNYPTPGQTPQERAARDAYLMGNTAVNWFGWTAASVLGIVLGNVVPTEWGLGFAGILALVGMSCSLVSTRLRLVSAGVAGCAAVAAFALPFKLNILVAIAAAVAICLMLEKTPLGRRERADAAH